MITDRGAVEGEVRNVTDEGVFIQSLEKVVLNEIYRLLMKAGEENIAMTGKLVWSNLDILPGMGFCFVEVNEEDREFLREAIRKHAKKEGGVHTI
jgi:hypothetical protein